MQTSPRRLDRWVAVPLAAVVAIAALDVLLGSEVLLGALLVVGPLLASLRLDSAHTAVVAVVAVVLSLILGITNDVFLEAHHITRVVAVLLAGIVAVWLARLRVERERAAMLLALQGSVSRILNESQTLAEATPRLLRVIGEVLGWQLGAVWEVNSDRDCIRRIETWRAAGFEAPNFEAASGQTAFKRGRGLPGRVWETRQPMYVPDFREDPSYPRSAAARDSGLHAAFAFPVRAGERVVGVIEFFATHFEEIGQQQLEMFSVLGRQVGQFIERRRSEEQRTELLAREHEARIDAERAERRAGETVALLDTLLARAPAGFAFIDRDLQYVRVNDALATIYGRSGEDLVGRPVDDVGPALPEVTEAVRRVIESGDPEIDIEVSGEAPGVPGLERYWVASLYPVLGAGDRVMGVGAVVVDITGRKRAEVRSHFLAEATAALNASLDYEITLANVARLTVPRLADWCVVDVLEREAASVRRLAIAHSDPSKEQLLWELDRKYPTDPSGDSAAAVAIRTGEPQLHVSVDPLIEAAAKNEDHGQSLRGLGFRSAMAVPLIVRGQAVGAVTFASAESKRVFDRDDLSLAVELSLRAGAAIENARLYRERSHIARTLQQSLLPPRLPDMPGVELAARYRAAGEANDVGGDFYDVFPTGERTWGVVVGDVLGKGPGAASMIGLARHTLRAAATREPDSVAALAILNDALYRESAQEAFCTAVYAAISVADDQMEAELTCAGHPLPMVLRNDGRLDTVGRPGTVLGAVPTLELEPYRISLDPGDALVMFTDGVLEARSEEGVFGEDGLRRLLSTLLSATAKDIAEQVARHAIDFQAGAPRDDLAVLVARRRAEDAPPMSVGPDDLATAGATPGDVTS
jgi:PAS domain S-box-containing protein